MVLCASLGGRVEAGGAPGGELGAVEVAGGVWVGGQGRMGGAQYACVHADVWVSWGTGCDRLCTWQPAVLACCGC